MKAIGAGLTLSVCFLYLGCGSIQTANAAYGSNTAPVTIMTRLLPSAIAGVPYVAALDATGGTPGYSWAVTSGKLPTGVALSSSTGVISGTPTAIGTFSVGVTLTDGPNAASKKVSTTLSLSVAAPSITMAPTTTLFAADGVAYSQTLQVTGGMPGYTWSIASGNLPAGLSLAASTGVISGTPSTSGITSFTVSVCDSEKPARTQSTVVTMDIAPPSLKMVAPPAATATVGASFSETLQATGGVPAYRWSLASGSLPAGLALNPATGAISGVPSASGTVTFSAMVSDSSSPAQASAAAATITVAAPALNISAASLPSVMVGTPYSQTLQVTGGTAPYRWSISSGALAPGLVLNAAGTISGVPTISGSSAFTVTVADSSSPSQSASAIRAVTVTATPLRVSAPVIPVGTVGTAYSQSFSVSGGTAPYAWQITSGSLPAGLSLSPSGTISGTALASANSTFTATVTDSSSPAQSASATTGIVVAPTALVITSSALAGSTAGAAYSQSLHASGGTAPYQWTITSGTLPAGLNLSPSSGAISGTATTSGTSNFTVTVTDSSAPAQVTSVSTSIAVSPAALSITSATLAQTTLGNPYLQTLQAVGGTGPYIWSITSGQLPLGLSLSASGLISGTPTSGSSFTFAVTVTDSGTPTQSQSATLTITPAASPVPPTAPLSILSSALSAGATGSSYSQTLQASGGTPGYTWTIASGSLPAGLTLAASTGVISGTPSAGGTSTFTIQVSDNSAPANTTTAATSIAISPAVTSTGPGTTWYVSATGAGLYSAARVAHGYTGAAIGCNGKGTTPYNPAGGPNQTCPLNDYRFLWDDQSGNWENWIISGGDTVILYPDQQWRVGFDQGASSNDIWCSTGWGPAACSNPAIPAGTASQHTRILGLNYANCSVGNALDPTKTTQIFGGFSVGAALNLQYTQYVDVQCLEITEHSQAVAGTPGECILHGIPAYPAPCSTDYPLSDYDSNGINTNALTSNVLLQDVNIHGHTSEGIQGPIGGPFTMLRVNVNFNGFAAWNFDNGSDTPNAPGSSINANYVTMMGNGCDEEYPIVHTQFPAKSCHDMLSGGFGDSWSGQDTNLDAFTCNHCTMIWNTKDGFIGPHTSIKTLLIENSESAYNMGQQWKWGSESNSTTQVLNTLTIGDCAAMSGTIPGAAHSFNVASGNPGAYLSYFCRAAGDVFSFSSAANSSVLLANNTVVAYSQTVFDLNCQSGPSTCGTTSYDFKNNIFLGYTVPTSEYPGANGQQPGLYYFSDPTVAVTGSYNVEYGVRNGTCAGGGTGMVCADPQFAGEPAQGTIPPESTLYNFNFHLASGSPAIGVGTSIPSNPIDYTGATRGTPPSIGAYEQ